MLAFRHSFTRHSLSPFMLLRCILDAVFDALYGVYAELVYGAVTFHVVCFMVGFILSVFYGDGMLQDHECKALLITPGVPQAPVCSP